MATTFTITEFEKAERELRTTESQLHFFLHMAFFIVINVILILLNQVVLPMYPWSIFPLVVWGIGLLVHYFVAFRWIRSENDHWIAKVEYHAAEIAQARAMARNQAV
ncbi:MAG TPA: 2TM domain-containing protein [Ktedonobacteraceae bacterium]|jgi:hypothetical protein|nr:2TM domain-containing protein [Ktedonobacteraceae bacterium]